MKKIQINSNKKEILFKGVKVFSIRVLGYIFGFLFTWILANKYGSRIQGIFAISFLFLSVGAMVSKLGIETAIVKWIANSTNIGQKKNVYIKSIQLILISSLIVGSILFLCAPYIAYMYKKPTIVDSLRLASIGIPFLSMLEVSANFFRGEKKTDIFGIYIHLLKFLMPFLIILMFFLASLSITETPILSYLIGLFLVSIVVVSHVLSLFINKDRFINNNFDFKYMFFESYPMMISSAIVMIMGWSDIFILGFYVSESEIGVYSTAIKLATVVSFVYNAVTTIATPKIASFFAKNNIKELKETISFSSKIIFISSLPIFFLIFCFPEIFLNFFGEEYTGGKTVLRILLLGQLTNVITGPVGPMFQMTGKQKKLQNFIMIALAINIILSVILVNILNVVGVAIASALGMMLWNILGANFIWRKMKLKTWISFLK